MARTVEVRTPTRPPKAETGTGTVRKTRVMVKRVGPWSVFKFSLLFYFCVMIIVLVALTILYNILSAVGVIDAIAQSIDTLLYQKASIPGRRASRSSSSTAAGCSRVRSPSGSSWWCSGRSSSCS